MVASNLEIVISISTIMVGIITLISVVTSWKRFHKGPFQNILSMLLLSISFLLSFSVWITARKVSTWQINIGDFMLYPEYLFITLAYLSLFILSIMIYKFSNVYGFAEEETKKRSRRK